MNLPLETLLRVTEAVPSSAGHVAVLGRDIRTSMGKITRYCLSEHEAVYEDLTILVESMAYFDRLVPRRRTEGWARQLAIRAPVWKTKGEVLSNLRMEGLTAGWEQTNSCSTRPRYRYGHHGCGICGGCLLRAVSAHAARIVLPAGHNAFDVYALEDIVLPRGGEQRRMTPGERNVAVRAIATMVEFSRLLDSSDGKAVVDREARLIDPSNFGTVQATLRRLLEQHRSEWDAFVCDLPDHSWVREIVGLL
jgi:hypothetical protein